MRIIVLLFLFIIGNNTISLAQTQNLRGKVVDADTQAPLVGVTVVLLNTAPNIGTATGTNGDFILKDIPVGRYQMQLSYVGYETLELTEVSIESGKETILTIALRALPTDISTTLVTATAPPITRQAAPLSVKTFSLEQVLRFPATFDDPMRLATTQAGVVSENDQANGIAIRGNSPNNMTWRLEHAEIVNPNHTSNAGTFNDRATANSGGVTILSAQLMDNATFLSGALPIGYSNALSGAMDFRLRKGNPHQQEFTLQAGLIGIDLSTEGPIKKDQSSYLFNYRYATIGVLDAMGVELGDEAITYQDAAFHIATPIKKGELRFFGMGGLSSNIFEADRSTENWIQQKDRQDIVYQNKMGALGANVKYSLGDRTRFEATAIFSALNTTRQSDYLNDDLSLVERFEFDSIRTQKISIHPFIQHKLNTKNRLRIGAHILSTNDYRSSTNLLAFYQVEGDQSGTLFQPYINWQWTPNTRFTSNVGLQYSSSSLSSTAYPEPRFSVKYNLQNANYIALAYSLQIQAPSTAITVLSANQDLDFSKAHHLVLGYHHQFSRSTHLQIEGFYQQLFDIPIVNEPNRSYSIINETNFLFAEVLENEGTGRNYGVEMSLQQSVQNGWYYLANATWYRSLYTAGDGIERSTRFDGKYIFNGIVGKEWTKEKDLKSRTWGFNVRGTYLGGFKTSPINVVASQNAGYTIFDELNANTISFKDYFKIDVRIYLRRNKEKYSSQLALDLQNATNQKNIAFQYYDVQQDAILVKNQLGLIPNLSYRIRF